VFLKHLNFIANVDDPKRQISNNWDVKFFVVGNERTEALGQDVVISFLYC
jgi:hypothetical protein